MNDKKANPEAQKWPSNQVAWKKFWDDYCKRETGGKHSFVNGRCRYCDAWKKDHE